MCREVFRIVQKMDLSCVENKIALQCAPIIKGIKISNLLIISSEDEYKLRIILKNTGIVYYRLLRKDGKTTFLLFRMPQLMVYLQDSCVQNLLRKYGYSDFSLGGILRTFQKRFETYRNEKDDFPHEIGLLLGYPMEDVIGFIEQEGKNYLYSGYWKVYADVSTKQELFRQYERVQKDVITLLAEGIGLRDIIRDYNVGNQMKLAG